jgi:hypothetical protein
LATVPSSLDAVDCFSRWQDACGGELSPDAARFFLAIRIPDEDRQRIEELMRRNGGGDLNDKELAALYEVMHLAQLLKMLQMRSRVVLQRLPVG